MTTSSRTIVPSVFEPTAGAPRAPEAFDRAVESLKPVLRGDGRITLVAGNGLSILPLRRPAVIRADIAKGLLRQRDLLKELAYGATAARVRAGSSPDDVIADYLSGIAGLIDEQIAVDILDALSNGTDLPADTQSRLTEAGLKLDAQLVSLTEDSEVVRLEAWNEYEKWRIRTGVKAPPLAHSLIYQLARDKHIDSVITTNYDLYLSSMLTRLDVPFVSNPCNPSDEWWDYDGYLSTESAGVDQLRLWKMYGDLGFLRYSCGHIVALPAKYPVLQNWTAPHVLEIATELAGLHQQVQSRAGARLNLPHCEKHLHDPEFYEADPWQAIRAEHLVDYNWPSRYEVFGRVMSAAIGELLRREPNRVILVLGYSGRNDPLANAVSVLADETPVIHIMADTPRHRFVPGWTSPLWDRLATAEFGFRVLDKIAEQVGSPPTLLRSPLMLPLSQMLSMAGFSYDTESDAILKTWNDWETGS